ncbi:hypothetical protein BKA80DRAFT_62394 [Phyllosticta citrichinensis]
MRPRLSYRDGLTRLVPSPGPAPLLYPSLPFCHHASFTPTAGSASGRRAWSVLIQSVSGGLMCSESIILRSSPDSMRLLGPRCKTYHRTRTTAPWPLWARPARLSRRLLLPYRLEMCICVPGHGRRTVLGMAGSCSGRRWACLMRGSRDAFKERGVQVTAWQAVFRTSLLQYPVGNSLVFWIQPSRLGDGLDDDAARLVTPTSCYTVPAACRSPALLFPLPSFTPRTPRNGPTNQGIGTTTDNPRRVCQCNPYRALTMYLDLDLDRLQSSAAPLMRIPCFFQTPRTPLASGMGTGSTESHGGECEM